MIKLLTKLVNNMPVTLGIVGVVLFTLALPIDNLILKNVFFLIGAVFLAIASLLEKEMFFSCLEGIVIITAILALLHVHRMGNTIILALLVLASIVLLLKTRKIKILNQAGKANQISLA